MAAPAGGRGHAATSRPSAASRPSLAKAREFADAGDLRFAAELLKPRGVRRSRPTPAAKDALADVYEQLGYGAENATWRNFYLQRRLRAAQRRPATRARPRRGHGGSAHRRSALRHPRDPHRRPAGRERLLRHPLELHRQRRGRQAHLVQRGPDPDPQPENHRRPRPRRSA